jgi:hypothetical protein
LKKVRESSGDAEGAAPPVEFSDEVCHRYFFVSGGFAKLSKSICHWRDFSSQLINLAAH